MAIHNVEIGSDHDGNGRTSLLPNSAPGITAGAFAIGTVYTIISAGTTNFTLIGAGASVTSGSFIIGTVYTIISAGTTNFTLIGAANSNVGTTFTATGVGVGTGTAGTFAVGTVFTASGVGTGSGTANVPDYRVPTGKSWAITTIMFCNVGIADPDTPNSDLTFLSLHLVKGGDPAGDKNMVLNAIPIPGGETFTFDTEKIILEENDLVYALTTSPEVISATISYLEV